MATYGSGTAAATVKVYSSSAYDGFGLAYTHAADTGTFDGTESGFGGQWGYYRESTTGQYLLGHRYYDPQRGRFVNRDPLGYGGGINLYGFTGNNPVNNQDPDGTDWSSFWNGVGKGVRRFFLGNGGVKGPRIGQGHGDVGLTDEEMDGLPQLEAHPQQAAARLSQGEAQVGRIVAEGAASAPLGGEGEIFEASTPILGRKLLYMLGKATGRRHNIDRSVAMARQLGAIGLHDTPGTRRYLTNHFTDVFADSTNIARVESSGNVVKDSLLVGPGGVLKVESYWNGNKLETFKVFGKK